MTLTYNGIWKATNSVNQDAAGSPRASVKSLSPVSGAGLSTVATAQFSATGGYGQIAYATVSYYSTDSNSYCEAQFYHGSSGSNWIYLGDDLASSWASSSLPGSGTISVSRCSLNVSSLSISGSGNNLTVTLPLQFATAFAGKKRVSVITMDNGIKSLALVASQKDEYRTVIFPYLLDHLKTCRPKEVPQHAEKSLPAVTPGNKSDFVHVLEKRLEDMTASQAARLKKIIKAAEKR